MKLTISILVKSECLKKKKHQLFGQNFSAAGYSDGCECSISPPGLKNWRQRHFVDIAIYKCNYCGNDWQIWVTLITWTWCLGDWLENIIFVWMKMNLNLNMNTWKWVKMKLNLTWTWTWSILVTKSVNEHTIWIRIIAWMWSGIAFKRLSDHEPEPTWNILATNVDMSEDATNVDI